MESILARLSNEDTIISVWMNEYEKNKREILALLPDSKWTIKSTIEWMFKEFDDNSYSYTPEKRSQELELIRKTIVDEGKKNKWEYYSENDFTPYFCNIFDYYNISTYTKKCGSNLDSTIEKNFDNWTKDTKPAWKSGFPLRLKIVLIILVWWLLTMWWVILFFSIKAKLSSTSENDDEEW